MRMYDPRRLGAIKRKLERFQKAKPDLCSMLPTPFEKLHNLSTQTQDVFIKREDLTGLAFGGNKTRMLQYVLGKAQMDNVTDIVAGAGFESNYCRQLAAACAKLGINAHLVLRRTQKDTGLAANPLPMALSGANITVLDEVEEKGHHVSSTHHKTMRSIARNLRQNGRKTLLLRTASDEEDLDILAIMYVIPFLSSCHTTHAGLAALRFMLHDPTTSLKPFDLISVAPFAAPVTTTWGDTHEETIATIVNRVVEMFGFSDEVDNVTAADIHVMHDFVGPGGYGVSTPESLEAMRLLAESEGLLLDPIYNAKAFAGMLSHMRRQRSTNTTKIYIHTGGLPALYSDRPALVLVWRLELEVEVCGRAVQSGGQFWAEHVNVICGDCTKVCATLPRQEILFFDPPWGGVDYKKEESVRLYLGSKPLSEVCRDLRDKCTFIALKLPLNADVSHITSSRDVTVTLDRKFRKMWLLVIRYISRKTSEREEEKNTSHANSATKKRDRDIGDCVIEKASSRTKKKQKRGLSVDSTAAEVPAKRSGKSPWIKAFSKRMNRPYWFNTVTSESLWHDPTKETRESAAVLPGNEAPVGKNVQSKSTDKGPKMSK
eukprot:g1386.t1